MPIRIHDANGDLISGSTEVSAISEQNSTDTLLGANSSFVGTFQEVKDYAVISVLLFSDQVSAIDGLVLEWSSDGINADGTDKFTYPGPTALASNVFTFGTYGRFFRIRYTNGAIPQTVFRLQSIMHNRAIKPSSHRIGEAISSESDAELIKAVLSGQDVITKNFANVGLSNTRLLVSTEQPPAPPGTTNVSITAEGGVTGTSDTFYTITNGQTLQLQKFNAGAASSNIGARVDLLYDPTGTGSPLTTINKVFLNGSNAQSDESFFAVGDGVARIILRRANLSGGTIETFARWQGFES